MKVGAQQIFTLVKDRRWPRTKKVLHEKSLECNNVTPHSAEDILQEAGSCIRGCR
ncbi:unnamed protein product [Penicillium camemberti]|uniref:Str. FM013 n=1 Tax=Penicillium camemberti (strain FM 013) TaxID=1429867 RepID=A0A0G4PDB3_PENC3|nr:unnamed protein product [Penicillium camemberti]